MRREYRSGLAADREANIKRALRREDMNVGRAVIATGYHRALVERVRAEMLAEQERAEQGEPVC